MPFLVEISTAKDSDWLMDVSILVIFPYGYIGMVRSTPYLYAVSVLLYRVSITEICPRVSSFNFYGVHTLYISRISINKIRKETSKYVSVTTVGLLISHKLESQPTDEATARIPWNWERQRERMYVVFCVSLSLRSSSSNIHFKKLNFTCFNTRFVLGPSSLVV